MGTLGGSPSHISASCHPTTRSSVSGGLGPPCPLTSRIPRLRRGDASSWLPRLVRVRAGTLTQNCQGSRVFIESSERTIKTTVSPALLVYLRKPHCMQVQTSELRPCRQASCPTMKLVLAPPLKTGEAPAVVGGGGQA